MRFESWLVQAKRLYMTQEGLYMKALDIQNKLGIDRVYAGVTHTNSDYEYNTHYVFFDIVTYDIKKHQGTFLYLLWCDQ